MRLEYLNYIFLFYKKKKKKRKERKKRLTYKVSSLGGRASSLASTGGGRVPASSSIFTSSELVWMKELVAARRLSFMELKLRLGKFSVASSLKSSNPAA